MTTDLNTLPTLTSEDYPTAPEMIATGHTFENGQWTSPAIKVFMAAQAKAQAEAAARYLAEQADPDAVWF